MKSSCNPREWCGLITMALLVLVSCTTRNQRSATTPAAEPEEGVAYVGGLWFDGAEFLSRIFYAVDGTFTTERPARLESTINLDGGFVVPPYGEAHNHNLEPVFFQGRHLDDKIGAYMDSGIWYVKNPGSNPRTLAEVRDKLAEYDVVEAVFSGGAALTTAGGHPEPQILRVISGGNMDADAGEGVSYFTVDSLDELATKWPRVLASEPDFVKTYLLHFDDEVPPESGWKGLKPVLLADIVARAHAAGLSVSAHVETAADFGAAVNAGVDEINHMPGFRPDWSRPLTQYELDPQHVAQAAAADINVVTTLYRGSRTFRNLPEARSEEDAKEEYRQLQIRNLRLLRKNGVRLVIGTDQYAEFSTVEARWLASLGVFTNAEILTMLCEVTPRSIFPDRAIGRLEEGYEASFLVLAGDPLAKFDHIDDIVMRFRHGHLIEISNQD